jgi:transcriptional regulator with XRE-family HTH domain
MRAKGCIPDMPRFDGGRLRARRKHLHITLDELARLSSLSYSTLMGLERNQTRPSIGSLERLCGALGCGPDMFFAPAGDDADSDLRPTELGRDADDWIARALATAPPLTRRQAERISAALFGRAS